MSLRRKVEIRISYMREYEAILILDPSSEVDALQNEIESNLKKRNVEIINKEDWGKRKLFHHDKKITEGYYRCIRFRGKPDTIKHINADLNVLSTVMRSMIALVN